MGLLALKVLCNKLTFSNISSRVPAAVGELACCSATASKMQHIYFGQAKDELALREN